MIKKTLFFTTISLLLSLLTPRSASAGYCFTNMSGNKTISTNCTLKTYPDAKTSGRYVGGVDSGTGSTNTAVLTVSAGTVTVNSNETLVAGSFNLSGGSIAVASGAKIEVGKPMWVVDADGDGYPASSNPTIYVQTSAPTNGRRLHLAATAIANGKSDCNDSNSSLNITCYLAFGDGHDGNVTITANTNINTTNRISGRSCADGGDAVNYSVTALGTNYATLSTTPSAGCLAPGDEVLLINLQGTSSYYTNVGNYEILSIDHITGNKVYFTTNKTKYYGNGANNDNNIGTATTNQRVMLQRLPNYNNLTINSGVNFYPSAWNGVKGGVIAFKVKGTLTINGTIHANYKGYRYGNGGESYCSQHGGGKGGPANYVQHSSGYPGVCGGGGGASGYKGGSYVGGAGSSRGGAGGAGGGGVNGTDSQHGGGGGGGGYGSAGYGGKSGTSRSETYGVNGGTNISGAGGAEYGWTKMHGGGGGGGGTYGVANLSKLYFGSAGGNGGDAVYGGGYSTNPGYKAYGGNGGGIVYIMANTINVNGYIKSLGKNGSNGNDYYNWSHTGNWSGGGGGGAGGSIKIVSKNASLNTNHVVATGGSGGTSASGGAGGAGGVGRIRVESDIISGSTNPAASTGPTP